MATPASRSPPSKIEKPLFILVLLCGFEVQ